MTDESRRRAFWVADELWFAAVTLARERGDSLAEVLRQALKRYVKRGLK